MAVMNYMIDNEGGIAAAVTANATAGGSAEKAGLGSPVASSSGGGASGVDGNNPTKMYLGGAHR
jgi:hypothetical protein